MIQGIFALFRKLHFRIDRKLTTGTFARYGLDEGLREADQDKRVLAIKENFPALHEMLQHHWSVRDFVGFKEKRLHSNSELIQPLSAQCHERIIIFELELYQFTMTFEELLAMVLWWGNAECQAVNGMMWKLPPDMSCEQLVISRQNTAARKLRDY